MIHDFLYNSLTWFNLFTRHLLPFHWALALWWIWQMLYDFLSRAKKREVFEKKVWCRILNGFQINSHLLSFFLLSPFPLFNRLRKHKRNLFSHKYIYTAKQAILNARVDSKAVSSYKFLNWWYFPYFFFVSVSDLYYLSPFWKKEALRSAVF